ncbi:MAG TPA: MurT ligase domain-containing protein [Jatrophihabitans sp.]|jgi:UDP-N-acetylmuramyl tripeptide synthase
MNLLAIWVGKSVLVALRLVGRRGNALPGLVVEKLFPHFLSRAMTKLAEGVVVVTGTNGKTTTTKMIATILGQRYRVLTNDTGSNFVRGAITATVSAATWSGSFPYDLAVFELDEAWAVRFVKLVSPRRAVLLNVMRDQLDRFGEIDTTAQLLGEVAAATRGHLVLNRDDERISALASLSGARATWYGVSAELRPEFPNDEELYGGPIRLSTQSAEVELLAIPTSDHPRARLRIGADVHEVALRAEGPHNAQNAAAAAAAAATFGLPAHEIAAGLAAVEPAFGRGQSFDVDGREVVLQLVKNPAGFRQTLHTLDTGRVAVAVVAINDDYADGRDVSWLWDVDFTALRSAADAVATSGTRAADMAVRLRYDDVVVESIEPNLDAAVREAVTSVGTGERVAIFSTYTAMWALHRVLLGMGTPATSTPAGAR